MKIGIELESMVSSVKDLLPDLGEGFIEVNIWFIRAPRPSLTV